MSTLAKITYLFPGQGAQYPGIGKDLYHKFQTVRDTYAEASDALGYDIAELSFNAPAEKINRTQYTQPVLLTHSIACLRAFCTQAEATTAATIAAGHSLGEYSALVSAEVISFEHALKLVKKRGELMGMYGQGEMAALTIDQKSATTLAEQHYCGIAACNLPEQTVVGGMATDLDALIAAIKTKFPRTRAFRLQTEGAFHTYYMLDAALKFRETLEQTEFNPPRFQVLSNFTGDFHNSDSASIRSRLFLQLFNPVMWHKNLLCVCAGNMDLLIEFGGGLGKGETPSSKRPNLEGMVKKTCQSTEHLPLYLPVINTDTLENSVQAFQ